MEYMYDACDMVSIVHVGVNCFFPHNYVIAKLDFQDVHLVM